MFFDSDIDAFFDEFTDVAYIGQNKIQVIFDLTQEVVSDYNVIGYKPMAEVKNSDVDMYGIEEDSLIRIRNVDYIVAYIQDNGFGTSKLQLEKQ